MDEWVWGVIVGSLMLLGDVWNLCGRVRTYSCGRPAQVQKHQFKYNRPGKSHSFALGFSSATLLRPCWRSAEARTRGTGARQILHRGWKSNIHADATQQFMSEKHVE